VPNLQTVEALRSLGIPTEKFSAELPKMVKAGLDRLYALQREDGGWGWFDNDPVDPFMTACAVAGLAEAKRLGYPVDVVRLERGLAKAASQASEEKDLNRLAYLCYALSYGPESHEIARLLAAKSELSSYALAAAAIALSRWKRAEAAELRTLLVARAKGDHWETESWYYKWENVTIETTALAVVALADERAPVVEKAVAWLLANRTGHRWRSTKDTAVAIRAILAHVAATKGKLDTLARAVEVGRKAGAPQLLRKATVKMSGAERELLVDLNDPASSRFECHFGARDLRVGENEIAIVAPDDLECDVEGVLRTVGGKPEASGVSIDVSTDRALDSLRLGDEVEVTVVVKGDATYDYLMVEVPVPAGCEVIRGSGEGAFARFEARYEEGIFFLRSVSANSTNLKFRMRSLFAGRYTVAAPSAVVMYDEKIGGCAPPRASMIRN
jgi:hypothetical protein